MNLLASFDSLLSLTLSSLFCSLCRVFSALSSTNPFTLSLSFHSVFVSLLLLPSLCSALSLSLSFPFLCHSLLLSLLLFFVFYWFSSFLLYILILLTFILISSLLFLLFFLRFSLLSSLLLSILFLLLYSLLFFSHLSSSHSSPFSFFSLVSAPVPSSLSLSIYLPHYIPLSHPPSLIPPSFPIFHSSNINHGTSGSGSICNIPAISCVSSSCFNYLLSLLTSFA